MPSKRSLSPLSLSPQVRNTLLAMTARTPLRATRSGRMARCIMSCISCGTPGTAYTILVLPFMSTGHMSPGAVPRVWAMMLAPFGTIACCKLFSAMVRPREAKSSRITSAMLSWNSSSTPITCAIASRVRSSCVGPSPPHIMTASASSKRARKAATMRSMLSPTFTCKCDEMPCAASCSPIHDELVSTI